MRKVLSFIATSVSLFVFAFGAQAEPIVQDNAQATNLGLYGGQIRYIAVDETSDYVYAGAYSPNGIFISADDGETWTGIPDSMDIGEPRGVVVADDGTLFVLAAAAYKSTDRGTTFTEMEEIGAYSATATYGLSRLLVGRTDGAVSVSDDNGETFTTAMVEEGSVVQSVATNVNGDLYAVLDDNTNTTLYRSGDFGESWSQVDTSDVPVRFNIIANDPMDENRLILTSAEGDASPWASSDGGSNWVEMTDVTPYVTKVSFDTIGGIYMGVDYSPDGGNNWEQINQSTPTSRVSGIVVPDPSNPEVLFAGSFAALAKSTDGGQTWSDNNEGLTAVLSYDVAQSTDKQTVWVATNAGLAKTENYLSEDRTWDFPIYYDVYPSTVWVSPVDSNVVVVGGMGSIVRTTDGGDNWTTVQDLDMSMTPQDIISDPNNPDVLYGVANVMNPEEFKSGGVFTSNDAGQTWESLNLPGDVAAQAISIASDGTVYVGLGALEMRGDGPTGLYKYDGSTWTELTGSPEMEITSVLVDPNDDNVVYATAANFDTYGADGDTVAGLYKSEDAGTTWTRITAGLEDGAKFRAMGVQVSTTPTTLYLSGTDKLSGKGVIYKSRDRGNSWGVYYTGLRNETFNTLLFDGLIAGNSRGVYDIKSFARIKLKTSASQVAAGSKITLNLQLLDKATNKKLGNRKVTIQRKFGKNGAWKKVKTVKVSKKGKKAVEVVVKKNTRYRVKFEPKRAIDKEEYTRSFSVVRKVKAL